MTMTETERFIKGLREAGWTGDEINDFQIYIASGEEAYKPKRRDTSDRDDKS